MSHHHHHHHDGQEFVEKIIIVESSQPQQAYYGQPYPPQGYPQQYPPQQPFVQQPYVQQQQQQPYAPQPYPQQQQVYSPQQSYPFPQPQQSFQQQQLGYYGTGQFTAQGNRTFELHEKLFHLSFGNEYYIKENGQPAFKIAGKFHLMEFDLRVIDAQTGAEVAQIISFDHHLFGQKHCFQVLSQGRQIGSFTRDFSMLGTSTCHYQRLDDGEFLQINGHFFNRNFTIQRNGGTVATIGKHFFSLSDSYGVHVHAGENYIHALAIALCIDKSLHEKPHVF